VALSPEDIVNHEFKQALRGYAVQEVDDLLDRLADQLERADRDIDDLRQRLRDADDRVAEARATESSLKRTLITAQDAAQRTIDDAQAHADAVRGEADREAAARLEDALARSAAMLEEAETEAAATRASYRSDQETTAARVVELLAIEDRYRTALRAQLEEHLAALEVLEASGPSGERDVEALRGALDGVLLEDIVDHGVVGRSASDHHADHEDPLVPFGGLTVRVREDDDGEVDEAASDDRANDDRANDDRANDGRVNDDRANDDGASDDGGRRNAGFGDWSADYGYGEPRRDTTT
jgi:DivIVA domain-containing protein